MARFFLITPPGLESAAVCELRSWGVSEEAIGLARRERGGLELSLPIELGIALPRRLKTPSRVLMRVADFGCRDFPKLFKKSRGLPWGEWLEPSDALEFEASSRRSRLRIKKRIAQTAADGAAAARGSARPDGAGRLVRSWIRFEDDVCEISLDLSGELQHRRGERTRVGPAPLRENLAAGLLYALAEDLRRTGAASDRSSGRERSIELFDPMCGAGAFGLEALALGRPAMSRGFAYEGLRPVREGRWVEARPSRSAGSLSFVRAIGWDSSDSAIATARANAESAGLAEMSAWAQQEVFSSAPLPPVETGRERWAIVNPPYGERLRIAEPLVAFYSRLAVRIEEVAKPDRAGLLLPAKADPGRLRWPKEWASAGPPIALSNGGIPAFFYRFGRRPRPTR